MERNKKMPSRQQLDRSSSLELAKALLAKVREDQQCRAFGPYVRFESIHALAIAVACALQATIKDDHHVREWFESALDEELANAALAELARRGAR